MTVRQIGGRQLLSTQVGELRSSKAVFQGNDYKQVSMHMHIHVSIYLTYHLPRERHIYVLMQRARERQIERISLQTFGLGLERVELNSPNAQFPVE